MSAYLIQFDLASLTARLSALLGSRLSLDEVREILYAAGFVESAGGWITQDLRPLMIAYATPEATPSLASRRPTAA